MPFNVYLTYLLILKYILNFRNIHMFDITWYQSNIITIYFLYFIYILFVYIMLGCHICVEIVMYIFVYIITISAITMPAVFLSRLCKYYCLWLYCNKSIYKHTIKATYDIKIVQQFAISFFLYIKKVWNISCIIYGYISRLIHHIFGLYIRLLYINWYIQLNTPHDL